MESISLTTFADFMNKSGTPKMGVVREWKYRGEYDPATDYWKRMRDGIVAVHQKERGLDTLQRIVERATPTKRENYSTIAKAYKKWIGRRSMPWFVPTKQDWESGKVSVQVNPELGLVIDGGRHLIKLYFKDDALPKNRAALVLQMMHMACGPHVKAGTIMAVLDVRKCRLHTSENPVAEHGAQLAGEAAYWAAVYPSV